MACLSDFWTVEGATSRSSGWPATWRTAVADATVPDDLVPSLRTTLAAIAFNSMIFSDHFAARPRPGSTKLAPDAGAP